MPFWIAGASFVLGLILLFLAGFAAPSGDNEALSWAITCFIMAAILIIAGIMKLLIGVAI